MNLTDRLPRLTQWLYRHKGATLDEVAAFYATCDRADLVDLDNRLRNVRADLRAFRRAEDRQRAATFAHDISEGVRRRLQANRAAAAAVDLAEPVADLDALDVPT